MKKFSKLLTIASGAAASFFYASPVFADNTLCPNSSSGFFSLCEKNASIGGIVSLVVNVVLFAGFALALIFLIIGGIKWITSGGDKAQTESAKQAVTSALIGLVVVLAAYILVNVILQFFGVGSVTNVNSPSINNVF